MIIILIAAGGNCDKVWQAWTPPVEDVPASQNLFPECQHCAQPSFSLRKINQNVQLSICPILRLNLIVFSHLMANDKGQGSGVCILGQPLTKSEHLFKTI